MLTGSNDYKVKFWDFNGMDQSLEAFRTIEPHEGYQVKDVRWSATGDCFLVATSSTQAKLYDRDGFAISAFAKGDSYLMDMKNTK